MSSVTHTNQSLMTHNVAALYGHVDDTLVAWQQACAQVAAALQPPPDPERLAKALALVQDGAVALEEDGAAQVTSGGTLYHLDADGRCHCADAQHRGAPCKHRLAMQIHQQATAQLAPRVSAAPPPPAPAPDTPQGRLPSADRWEVTEAPASCCLRLRMGELELMYTMRDVSDAELTSRVQHLVPWVQDVLDQARERHAHLEAARQQREAVPTTPAAPVPPAPQAPSVPPDLQALVQQAVQQVLASQIPSHGTLPTNGTAPSAPPPTPPSNGTASSMPVPDDQQTGFCSIHQVPMVQKQNARGTFYGHWLAAEQRHCNGRRAGRR